MRFTRRKIIFQESLDYYDYAPSKFNATIQQTQVEYVN